MNRMLQRLVLSAVILVAGACAAAGAGSPSRAVLDRFTAAVAADWKTYDVTEHFAPAANREAFARRAFRWDAAVPGTILDTKEVHVGRGDGTPALHLGVVHLKCVSPQACDPVYGSLVRKEGQYLAGTKILTRYVVVRKGAELLIVYSETHRQPRVDEFLDALESSSIDPWQQ